MTSIFNLSPPPAPPPLPSDFPFGNTIRVPKFYAKIFQMIQTTCVLHYCWLQRESLITSEILEIIFMKNWSFLLTNVQQMQPTLTLHCLKLVQNIKITIPSDERVYTWKILAILQFECIVISAILNLSLLCQQSLPIPQVSKLKMASSVRRPCFALSGQKSLWGCFAWEKKGCFVA